MDLNESSSQPKVVTIDLEHLSPAGKIETDELIRIREFNRLKDRIVRAATELEAEEKKETKDGENPKLIGSVFFIDGTRGAGKTTFLKTMISEICASNEEGVPHFEKLAFIDPTLIETGEHILFSVLASLDALVRDRLLRSDGRFRTEDKEEDYESWRRKLQDIARGLTLLRSCENGRDYPNEGSFDEIVDLNGRLDNAKYGLDLWEGLKELFGFAKKTLKVSGFILGFDDVDTNFKRGWEVLEFIRRYGNVPGLFILITGDLQLYTHLVRDNQFRNFSDSLAKNDRERVEERTRMVDHLEQQYLLKLFPVQDRIHLASIQDMVGDSDNKSDNKNNFRIAVECGNGRLEKSVKKSDPKEGKKEGQADDRTSKSKETLVDGKDSWDISDAVNKMLVDGLALKEKGNESDRRLYREHFLRFPVRSVLQILNQYNGSLGADKKEEKDPAGAPAALAEAMRGSLQGSLYKQGIDTEAIENGVFGKLVEAVFDLSLAGGDLDTGYYLRPQAKEETLRNCSIVLAAEVARLCKGRPDLALRYILQGPGSVSLYNKAQNEIKKSDGDVSLFKKYYGLGREEKARHWALRAPSVLIAGALKNPNNLGIGCGILNPNMRISSSKRDNKHITLNEILSEPRETVLPVAVSYVQADYRNQILSLFNLIGAMEELLSPEMLERVQESCNAESDEEENRGSMSGKDTRDPLEEKVQGILNQVESGNTVTVAPWLNPKDEITEEEEPDEQNPNENGGSINVNTIVSWLKFVNEHRLNQNINPSALFLGKIWSRLYFSLCSIADEFKSKINNRNANPDEVFSFNVLSFMNAILTEECYYHKNHFFESIEVKVSRKNPVSKANTLKSKINLLKKEIKVKKCEIHEILPFSSIIMSCPLLLQFLTEGHRKVVFEMLPDVDRSIKRKKPEFDISDVSISGSKNCPKKEQKDQGETGGQEEPEVSEPTSDNA